MNAKEVLKSIKALFSEMPPEPTPAPAPVVVEMKEYSLADGTKVMLDKLEIGGIQFKKLLRFYLFWSN